MGPQNTAPSPMMNQALEITDILLEMETDARLTEDAHEQALVREAATMFGNEGFVAVHNGGLVDTRVRKEPLIRPSLAEAALPLSELAADTTRYGRAALISVVRKEDPRLSVNVGGCSTHNLEESIEYVERYMVPWQKRFGEYLLLLNREYIEKPRSGTKVDDPESWKGLANDPLLDKSEDINLGNIAARMLFLNIAEKGVLIVTELLDGHTPQYVNGLVTEAIVGARSVTDPRYRALLAASSAVPAFKNPLDGDIEIAVAAAAGATKSHSYKEGMEITGRSAIIRASGNPDGIVILRGNSKRPNYYQEDVEETKALMERYGLDPSIAIDLSHMNSRKIAERQSEVAHEAARQIASGEEAIVSIHIESYLKGGKQDFGDGKHLEPGLSVTDECIGPEQTEDILEEMAGAVKQRMRTARSH